MNNTAISINNIHFAYADTPVLADFSLQIQQGSFVCLTGESGCGKSTLLRLINGLLLPQQGSITIDGVAITPHNVVQIRRNMGYILQENSLFPHFTAYQNMVYCLNLDEQQNQQKNSHTQHKKRIDELLPLVNLDASVLEKFPHELSGGQRQRVGIIRGIAHKPNTVMMDEPFSALDPETRAGLQDLVKTIHEKTGTTFVMVTHAMDEAEKLGTEIVRM